MDETTQLFDELTRTAIEQIERARAARSDDDRRDALAGAVRSLTRLWSATNPDFDRNAYNAISAMVEASWPQIVAGRNGAEIISATWPASSTSAEAGREDAAFVSELAPWCAVLAREPLFGARELLHSNLLAWFIDAEPAVANVFAAWSDADPAGVDAATQREKYSFDLIVQSAGRAPLVIENKIFSAVDPTQLERYTTKAVDSLGIETTFVLLSLIDPQWEGSQRIFGSRAWTRRSYGELGSALELAADHLAAGPDQSYRQQVLRRYAATLVALDGIATAVTAVSGDDTVELPASWERDLEAVRLAAGFSKLRSQRVAGVLDQLGVPGVVVDMSRSKPLLERFWAVPNSDGDTIGWQFQEGQWRLAVRVGSAANGNGRGAEARAVREAYVQRRYEAFFDFDQIEGPLVAKVDGDWLGFQPNFVHRYRRVPASITVSQLAALAVSSERLAVRFL